MANQTANIQLPVLFAIEGADATLYGEAVADDIIENHLPFILDRTGAFTASGFDTGAATSKLIDVFEDTFYVGDPTNANTGDENKLFFVNMVSGVGTAALVAKTLPGGTALNATPAVAASQVVDMFCNKLASAILITHNSTGLQHIPVATKKIPIGGKAALTEFAASVAPAAAEQLNIGSVMARVASVHLVGHPLAQAIFSNEDEIQGKIVEVPATHVTTNPGGIFKTQLARLLSVALGGSQAANKIGVANNIDSLVRFNAAGHTAFELGTDAIHPQNSLTTADPFFYDLTGVPVVSGVANDALKSIYEQLLNVSGRAANLSDNRGVGYNFTLFNGANATVTQTGDITGVSENAANTVCAPLPLVAGDKMAMFLRPKLQLKFDATITAPTNIQFIAADGTVTSSDNVADISTGTNTASVVASVFPGYADTGAVPDAFQVAKFGWMGSTNTINGTKTALRTLSQTTTNLGVGDEDILDEHIWKINISL